MAEALPNSSQLETALGEYGPTIQVSLEEDLVRRGVANWPSLDGLELVLFRDINDRYYDDPTAAEARRPDNKINLQALVVNSLRLAKRIDQIARLQTDPRRLLPASIVDITQLKGYTNSLFNALPGYFINRPKSVKLAQSFTPYFLYLTGGIVQLPFNQLNERDKLLTSLYTNTLQLGFIALERAESAESSEASLETL